jgi:6-phospho-beta-glucosidase
VRVAVVGGGSTYTPELIHGVLARHDRLPVREVVLVDPDLPRVQVVGEFARRMAARAGVSVDITWTDDLVAAVSGAQFVVSQLRVGGQQARHQDESLGREFGLIGQETVGVGGFAKALRTIPVAVGVARAVVEHAPDAILLNFTNPAGLVTEAISRAVPDVRVIGLCNVPWNIRADIADAFSVPFDDLTIDSIGLNHLSWVRSVSIDGQDLTDQVLTGVRRLVGKQATTEEEPNWTDEGLEVLRAIPNYYLMYYYETRHMLRWQSGRPTRASEVMRIEADLLARYSDPTLTTRPDELMLRGGAHYSDSAVALMADIHQDAGSVHVVNVPSAGAVPGVDPTHVMEIPATIDHRGATPLPTAAMSPSIDALVRTVKDYEVLTIRAALEGDVDSALQALLTNPLGPDASAVVPLWRRLVEVNRGHLGALA